MILYSDSLEKDLTEALKVSHDLAVDARIEPNETLESRMDYLSHYANYDHVDNTICVLAGDFAPLSFAFAMYRKAKPGEGFTIDDRVTWEFPELGGYTYWFNGGLIFHGKHDNGGDGGMPTLSVNLTPTSGWSVHT